ncbi:MAG: putative lipid II flippase FtsW [Myxococcaceae bacterium]
MVSKLILIASLSLMILGIVIVYSSSAVVAHLGYHDSLFFLKRQLVYVSMGIGVFVGALFIDPLYYRKYAYHLYVLALVLLILVLIPGIGKSAGGAARWISLGFIRIQAGEVFKFALVSYLAMSLAKKGSKMHLFHVGIVPHLILPGVAMILLLLEPDFGTTVIVASVTFIMLFIGGARVAYLLGAVFLALPVLYHIVSSSPYRMARVMAFLDPWTHRQEGGYQVVQSLMTLGSGGWFGLGLGQGPSKLYFLPAAHTDFILAVIGEELGFIGIVFVVGCFVTLLCCGFWVAFKSKDIFKTYLATGLTSVLIIQAVLNSFVVMGLLPTKGLTLPLVSYGGSSLMIACLMLGILFRLSRELKL